MMKKLLPALVCLCAAIGIARAQSPYQSSGDFAKYAMRMRESALTKIEPQVVIPTSGSVSSGKYPWKTNIVTTIFWVGEAATVNNPVHNVSSSWDVNWRSSFGGFDNPSPGARRNYIATGFTPLQNPFYFALPYNDVTRGTTKPEVRSVIPWYKEAFEREGKSICHNRWIAIRGRNGRTAYAQWADCGPFRTDHYQYVFGNERPKSNLNRGAGLDVSPAVRDYLGLGAGLDVTDWKFVDFRDVPQGPWARYGENNHFVINARKSTTSVVNKAPPVTAKKPPASAPTVTVR